MVIEIEMLVGDKGRLVNVSQEKADAFIGAGFARLSKPSLGTGGGLEVGTIAKPKLGRPNTGTLGRAESAVEKQIADDAWNASLLTAQRTQFPSSRPLQQDAVDPVTGFDVDVMQYESPGPTGGSAIYVKPNPVAAPVGVPVKTDPLTAKGETGSTGRPATVIGGVMPNPIETRWTGRLPGGGTVGAPRSGPDDPSTMPGGVMVEVLGSGLPISPRATRIIKNVVPVAAHVACRILTKGRLSGPQSKALCGLLAAGLKRAIQ